MYGMGPYPRRGTHYKENMLYFFSIVKFEIL